MRAYRIGYVLTVSFMLVLAVVTFTLGFFPPPAGPKAPTYPTYPASTSSTVPLSETQRTAQLQEYDAQMEQYRVQTEQYQEEQKTFLQSKIIPYAQGIFLGWIIFLIVFEVLGLFLARFVSPTVGGAYSFSGVWAVLFGPLGGLLWFVNSLVSSFASRAEAQFSADMILQSIGVVSFIGVLILTLLGLVFLRDKTAPQVTQ